MLAPDITTGRLLLSRLTADDAGALFAYRSLPEVCRYQHWQPSRVEDAEDFIERQRDLEFDSPGTWFQLGIRTHESGRLIGDLGVHFVEDGQAEIGFTLAPGSQGRGFATEAVIGLLDYLFGSLGKHRVFASVDPRNESSRRLLQRVGMRQEAHCLQSVRFKGTWTDDLVFAILASEWRARSPRAG